MEKIEIIYQDDDICIINKPAGLAVHKSKMTGRGKALLDCLDEAFAQMPSPVHRLDQPTSGLLIGAFSRLAASRLSEDFREGNVSKEYLAIVRGWVPEQDVITTKLNRYNPRGKSLKGESAPQEAETEIFRLGEAEFPLPNNRYQTTRFSLVKVCPKTGRYHQIRRHLAGRGYPIVGDTSHGDTRINHLVQDKTGYSRLMLHAHQIEFTHPVSRERMQFICPPSDEMIQFIEKAGWSEQLTIRSR